MTNIEVPSRNHCCLCKAILVTYSEFLSVALFMQHAMRIRRIILSSVACLTLPYIPHYPITGTILGEKVDKDKMCVLILSTILSEYFSF